jgi:hypothetical protein
MDAELKAKWTAALRSGEFKQHQGQLRAPDKSEYCCLGVLCEIAGIKIGKNGLSPAGYGPIYKAVGDEDICSALYQMNDSGRTFTEIADYIDKTL